MTAMQARPDMSAKRCADVERIVVLIYEFDHQQLIKLFAGIPFDDEFDLRARPSRAVGRGAGAVPCPASGAGAGWFPGRASPA